MLLFSTLVTAFSPPPPTNPAQNAYAGCLVAPDDSVFNTPIDNLPVHPNSAAWIAQSLSIAPVGVSFGEAWGVNIVDNSVTPSAMTFYYTTANNNKLYPLLKGNNRTRETGAVTSAATNNDHHMITLNRQTCHWYETYNDNLTESVTPEPAPYATSGWDYLGTSYTQPTDGTTDAAGLPLMPLTVHLSEMQAGAIHHAMRFTTCAGCVSGGFLWPATGSTGYSASSAPMGSRWRLKASYDDSHLSPKARIITTALKSYGMILADRGGISQVQVAQDITLDPSASAAFGEVAGANITQSDFEVVDESSLMLSANSSQAKGGTPTSAPVLPGTPSPVLFVQAGTSYQLTSWVNGASDQTVLWSLASGAGSVTTAGVYTAPTSVTPARFVLKGVAEADTLNPVFVSGSVMPAGTMRINVGDVQPYVDTNGNTWLADNFGFLTGSFTNNNDTWPPDTWAGVGAVPDGRTIFGWSKYTWGDDIQYGPFIVPNGPYAIQFWMGRLCDPGTTTYSETQIFNNNLTVGGVVGLEANGAMTLYDIGSVVHDACHMPATPTIQTVVTNHVLRVALRSTSVPNPNTQQAPFLNALIIAPGAPPQIQLAPASLTFNGQQIGTSSAPQHVTIQNYGNVALATSIMVSNSANFDASSNCPVSLLPGTSCTVTVTFAPTASGNQAAILTVNTNSAISVQPIPISGIGISGTGSGLPKITVQPASLNFGTQQVRRSAPQTVTVTNSGTALLQSGIALSGVNATDFNATSTCGAGIAPNTSCIITVTFAPLALGNRVGTLVITSNAQGSPRTVPLSGAASALPPSFKHIGGSDNPTQLLGRDVIPIGLRPRLLTGGTQQSSGGSEANSLLKGSTTLFSVANNNNTGIGTISSSYSLKAENASTCVHLYCPNDLGAQQFGQEKDLGRSEPSSTINTPTPQFSHPISACLVR